MKSAFALNYPGARVMDIVKVLGRLGVAVSLLFAIAPLQVAYFHFQIGQDIAEFAVMLALTFVFTVILVFIWEAVQAIGHYHVLIPFGFALVILVAILQLNAIEPDVQLATAGFLGMPSDYVYMPYYDLLDLIFIVAMFAGITEILKQDRHKVIWLLSISVVFFIFTLWLVFNPVNLFTYSSVFLAACYEASRLIPSVGSADERGILKPIPRYGPLEIALVGTMVICYFHAFLSYSVT
jgi:hypothetical protein